jgi:uncharacterized membrane protein
MKKRSNQPVYPKMLLALISVAALIISIPSCDLHEISYPEEEYESFSESIQPIFTSACTRCHSSGTLNLTEGSSYISLTTNGFIDTDNPESSLLYTTVVGSEHRSYTTTEERKLILEWIRAGAPND